MKESTKQSTPEVDVNPHSDLPASGGISTEIKAAEPQSLPFGVLSGKKKTPPPATV